MRDFSEKNFLNIVGKSSALCFTDLDRKKVYSKKKIQKSN